MASLKKMCDVFVVVFCWNQVRVRLILDPPNVTSACPHFSVFLFLGVAGKKKNQTLWCLDNEKMGQKGKEQTGKLLGNNQSFSTNLLVV